MKLFMKLFSLFVLMGLFVSVPANAQHRENKASMHFQQGNNHDGDRDGRGHQDRDRDGRDHHDGDRDGKDHDGRDHDGKDHDCGNGGGNGGGSNNIAITVTITTDGVGSGTVSGPASVPSGKDATYIIVPDVASSSAFVLLVDGVPVYSDNTSYSFTLVNVTAPHTIEVFFSSLI